MKELLPLLIPLGVLFTFLSSILTLVYTRKIAHSTKYIDTITTERILWIEKIRLEVADLHAAFLTMIKNYHFIVEIDQKPLVANYADNISGAVQSLMHKAELQNEIAAFAKTELLAKINVIRLRLNPQEDTALLTCLDQLMSFLLGQERTRENIQRIWDINLSFISLAQRMLKDEWEKVKQEARGKRVTKGKPIAS